MREECGIEQNCDVAGESERSDTAGDALCHCAHVVFGCDGEFDAEELLQLLEIDPLSLERHEDVVRAVVALHEDVLTLGAGPLELLLLLFGIVVVEDRLMVEFLVGDLVLPEEADDRVVDRSHAFILWHSLH